MEQSTRSHRIGWIDFGKGLTIFLVVVAHTFSGIYTNNIYNSNVNFIIRCIGEILFLFIMPVFFSLSGYLYKSPQKFSDYIYMLKKKAWNLITPYVAFSFIYILLNQVGGKNNKYTWNMFLHIYAVPISYLWFLYILFFIFILVGALSVLRVRITIQIYIYLLAFIIIKISGVKLYIFNVFGWAIFFCLGIIFKGNIHLLNNKICYYTSLLLTIISIIILFMTLGTGHQYYNNVSLINFIPKVISDIFMFSLFLGLPSQTKFFSYFKHFGKYSLVIYMVHAPLLSASRVILLKLGVVNEVVLVFILLLIGWYGSLIVVYLNNRFKIIHFVFNAYSTIHKK